MAPLLAWIGLPLSWLRESDVSLGVMGQSIVNPGASAFARVPVWPMVGVCMGVLLLPWHSAPFRSGVLSDGKYALLLGVIGLLLYGLAATRHLQIKWWRLASIPLALGCLAIAVHALNGHAALGAIVTALSAVAWLVLSRRPA